jgi:hypothetical protein
MKKLTRGCGTVSVLLSVTILLISNVSLASAQTASRVIDVRNRVDIPSDIIVRETHISLLKTSLNLRPSQEHLWTPVEAALYEMARWQASKSSAPASSDRASGQSAAAVMARIKRIAAVATPLLKALDENQKSTMKMLARTAGLEQLLASN